MATTWRSRRRIVTWSLKNVINETVRYRAQRCPPPATPPGLLHEQQLLQAVNLFQRARLYVPIETRCLLDSISLTRFLARRHFHSKIVLGVTNDPFSAHCCCPAGDIAIKDRKSVGEGKSVSVRVDSGGRRILKKKKDI